MCKKNMHCLSLLLHQYFQSWFYKIFNNKIEDSLKKGLLSLLCNKAHDVDKKWNAKISSYPCKYIVDMFNAWIVKFYVFNH